MRQQEPITHISIVFHIYLNFYKHYLTVGNKLQTKVTLTQENEGRGQMAMREKTSQVI